eukprot:SAG31_NODE_765_length_12248_cov_6.802947_21_plen_88_part_00
MGIAGSAGCTLYALRSRCALSDPPGAGMGARPVFRRKSRGCTDKPKSRTRAWRPSEALMAGAASPGADAVVRGLAADSSPIRLVCGG